MITSSNYELKEKFISETVTYKNLFDGILQVYGSK